MDDPDAIWKPGYDGPPPVAASVRERPLGPATRRAAGPGVRGGAGVRADERGGGAAATRGRRRRSRRLGQVAGVAFALATTMVVVDPLGIRSASDTDGSSNRSPTTERAGNVVVEPFRPSVDPPDPSVFGGAAARRLPEEATALWSVEVPFADDHWVEVMGRSLVLVAVDDPVATSVDPETPDSSGTTLIAFDAPTGARRWVSRLPSRPSDVTVIGAVDDVVVLQQPGAAGPILSGFDTATGTQRWSREDVPGGGHVGLVGTGIVARLPGAPDDDMSLIDARSGRTVAAIGGEFLSSDRAGTPYTDGDGRWYVIDDGEVLEYDLRAVVDEPRLVGTADDAPARRIVVDRQIASIDAAGSLQLAGAAAPSPSVSVSDEVPARVQTLTPVSDSDFVVTSPGSIAGLSVQNGRVDVTWSNSVGVLVGHHPVVGGVLLQVATGGGAATQLVDGLTGRTVANLTMTPGALQSLVVLGDGIVTLRTSELGTELAGLNLDGTVRWTLPGSTPVTAGDRILVRTTAVDVTPPAPDRGGAPGERRLYVTAHGDVE